MVVTVARLIVFEVNGRSSRRTDGVGSGFDMMDRRCGQMTDRRSSSVGAEGGGKARMFPESEARNRSKPAGPASRLRLIGWKSLPLIGSGLVGPNSKSHEARVQPEVMSVDLFFSHETFLAVPESGFRVRCQRLFGRVAKRGAVARRFFLRLLFPGVGFKSLRIGAERNC